MKKLIIALIFLVGVVTASVLEIVYLERTYDGMIERLQAVEVALDVDLDHVDNERTLSAMQETLDYWQSRRNLSMSLVNHAQTKSIDDRLATAMRQCEVNAGNDASVSVRAAIGQFEDFKSDAYPNWTNLF